MTITGLMKLTRLIRLLRFLTSSSRFSQYGAAVLLFLMSMFALIAHWLACVFYAIAANERDDSSKRIGWLDELSKKLQMPITPNDTHVRALDVQSKYVTSLYFTITMLASIGFGKARPGRLKRPEAIDLISLF